MEEKKKKKQEEKTDVAQKKVKVKNEAHVHTIHILKKLCIYIFERTSRYLSWHHMSVGWQICIQKTSSKPTANNFCSVPMPFSSWIKL